MSEELLPAARAEEAPRQRLRQLELLSQAGAALILADPAAPLPLDLFDRVRRAVGAEILLDYRIAEPGMLTLRTSRGLNEGTARMLSRTTFGEGLSALVLRRQAPLVFEDLQDSRISEARLLMAEGARAFAGFPLWARGGVVGIAAFAWTSADRIPEADLQLIGAVCTQASAMLERAQALEELRARERALQAANRRKDDFIATLAHELRNPLAPIRNAAQVLRRPMLRPDLLRWCRDVIERQVTQMSRLLDSLLDVSRITRSRIELQRERIELARIVEGAVEATRPLVEAQQQKLDVALPDEPLVLHADPTRMTQVLSNLLHNAAKYTDRGGRITLAARREGDTVKVAISDTGIGIDPEQLRSIFEMFSQLTPALQRSHGGLGIGLSLARGLVELHGGRIQARSEGPGRGSEFVVTLPLAPGAPAEAPQPEAPPVREGRTGGRSVAVVDDNADAAMSLAAVLCTMGYEARHAASAAEGLALVTQWEPAAAVLDIGMPGMDGYELCRAIRALRCGPRIALVACTGWGQAEDRERARAAGFDGHVVKPVDAGTLARRLDEAIARRRGS